MISRLTCMTIQTNEVACDSSGPDQSGKFAACCHMIKNGKHHALLLSTPHMFNTASEAIEKMGSIVKQIKETQ